MGLFNRKKNINNVEIPSEDYFKPVEELEVESLPVGSLKEENINSNDTIETSNQDFTKVDGLIFDDDFPETTIDDDKPLKEEPAEQQDLLSIIGIPNNFEQPAPQPMMQQPMVNQNINPQPMMQQPAMNPEPMIQQESLSDNYTPTTSRFIGEIKSEEPIYKKKEEVPQIHGSMSIFNTKQIPTDEINMGGRTR